MLKSHERFHSVNGKRLILIADDEFVNRELMKTVLQGSYELIFATNGQEALDQARKHKDTLSLVLLDLMMPVLSGMEMLKIAKADPEISRIPIIVISADQNSEVESLTVGASDFIPKPYPQPSVILARVFRTIELSEDRDIISSTERDDLTGLYNREYFYRYAEQYDQYHKSVEMDAIVVDVNHFHMINERFGTQYGDHVLKQIGESLRESVSGDGGIVCRREADTFLVYCPHLVEYEPILDAASNRLMEDDSEVNRVWLRMGVYPNCDKTLDIERRFDRAKMAAETVRGSFARRVGVYNIALHEEELYSEQLIEDFDTAIKEGQFLVFYQPKFDVRPDIPVLASAEALVRWHHPKLGMISPGIFIPLFENNGLIQHLDLFVWDHTAAQIRDWKDRLGFAVPVSVNVSRIDMYDPHLVDTLLQVLKKHDLETHDLYLEITESAYTQDSEQIIQTVHRLRDLGFHVEMDDFGTGYSSLNMISSLPIDALKLDMQFIRSAFSEQRDTRMLEVIIDIADYLSVPVIAEGVETEEQVVALRAMGCDYVQGYYFSRPVPTEEYEYFVIERKHQSDIAAEEFLPGYNVPAPTTTPLEDSTHSLSAGFETIYYVDTETDHYVAFNARGRQEDLQIEESGDFATVMQDIIKRVHPHDAVRVSASLEKEALMAQLTGIEPFIMTYRSIGDGGTQLNNIKAVRARTHDNHHIVVGISVIIDETGSAVEGISNELDFAGIAQELSGELEALYYVDINTDNYQEFNKDTAYASLPITTTGKNFFAECQVNLRKVVLADDQANLSFALEKQRLLTALERHPVYSIVYRLVIDGVQTYYRTKVTFAHGTRGHHLIVGVSNVDNLLSEEEKLESQRKSSVTYAAIIQALATDYVSIFYVDTLTDRFIEYSSRGAVHHIGGERSGDDFFTKCRLSMQRALHPEDTEMFLHSFTKESILSALKEHSTFTMTYRTVVNEQTKYAHLKATRIAGHSDNHIVIGVSDVSEQILREQEHARALRMANQDSLTGVKSKHAYATAEREINQAIIDADQAPFAIAVCDVNDLKKVNDTLGHAAGDQYIRDACMIVCNVFKHSPVYRIGGDEFVAILRGSDYNDRHQLMERLAGSNRVNQLSDGVIVAGGMSEWQPDKDPTMAHVFARADDAMYANKRDLKRA